MQVAMAAGRRLSRVEMQVAMATWQHVRNHDICYKAGCSALASTSFARGEVGGSPAPLCCASIHARCQRLMVAASAFLVLLKLYVF